MSQVALRAGQPVLEGLPAHWGQRHEAARQARVQSSTPHTAMGAASASPVRPQIVLAVAAFAPPAAYNNELVREGGSPFSKRRLSYPLGPSDPVTPRHPRSRGGGVVGSSSNWRGWVIVLPNHPDKYMLATEPPYALNPP